MSTVPVVPGGETAVIAVSELTVELAARPPKLTAVAPVKPLPAIVTLVPPAAGPLTGVTFVTAGTGGGATNVNLSAVLVELVPPGPVTVTSTVPVPGGETAVIDVSELTVKLAAAPVPKLTAVAPANALPVIITLVPPAVVPLGGLIAVPTGGAGDRGVGAAWGLTAGGGHERGGGGGRAVGEAPVLTGSDGDDAVGAADG